MVARRSRDGRSWYLINVNNHTPNDVGEDIIFPRTDDDVHYTKQSGSLSFRPKIENSHYLIILRFHFYFRVHSEILPHTHPNLWKAHAF